MRDSRTCTRCRTLVTWDGDRPTGCPTCVAELDSRRDVNGMTADERVAEFDSWGPILEVPFARFHERMQELVGRPIFTHEFAQPDLLRVEILTGNAPGLDGVLAKLPADKPVIPVGAPEFAGATRRAADAARRFAEAIPEGIGDDGATGHEEGPTDER
jgi:hypothetical protein